MNYTEVRIYTGQPEYSKHFWNAMRGQTSDYSELSEGRSSETGTYAMPNATNNKYEAAIINESLFLKLAQPLMYMKAVITSLRRNTMTLRSLCRKAALSQFLTD